jgi:hypothetical protein
MKKLVVLLSALLVLSTFTSSPSLASPSQFEYRIQSFLAMLCRNVLSFSGVVIVPGEVYSAPGENNWGPRVGGDADDLANGKGSLPGDSRPNANGSSGEFRGPVWCNTNKDSK